LDEFECESKETARKFEQLFIDQFPDNLNTNRAYTELKKQEYFKNRYEENKKIIAEQQKIYKQNNREKIAEREKIYYENTLSKERKELVICPHCNLELTKGSLPRHLKRIHPDVQLI
jgi:hypothetical protein